MIKKIDSKAEDIKGLSRNIKLLTSREQSQNKFLDDMMSAVKSLVSSKSPCDLGDCCEGRKEMYAEATAQKDSIVNQREISASWY